MHLHRCPLTRTVGNEGGGALDFGKDINRNILLLNTFYHVLKPWRFWGGKQPNGILTKISSFLPLNRSSRRKRGMASNPLFIIPDFFCIFPINFAMTTLKVRWFRNDFWYPRILPKNQRPNSFFLPNITKNVYFRTSLGRIRGYQKVLLKLSDLCVFEKKVLWSC